MGKMISQKEVKNSAVYVVLKATWTSYGSVKMTDLEDGVMTFDFQNESDRNRVLDMSPWAIHGHCLNLKASSPSQCTSEINFGLMSFWV